MSKRVGKASAELEYKDMIFAEAHSLMRMFHHQFARIDLSHLFTQQTRSMRDYIHRQRIESIGLSYDDAALTWRSVPNEAIKPLDVERLTFRGNGIPENADKLKHSAFLSDSVKHFYRTINQERPGKLWIKEPGIFFNIDTNQGVYTAYSQPFIAIYTISDEDFAAHHAKWLPVLLQPENQQLTFKPYDAIFHEIQSYIEGNLTFDAIHSLYGVRRAFGLELIKKQGLEATGYQLKASDYVQRLQAMTHHNALFFDHKDAWQDVPAQIHAYAARLTRLDPKLSSLFLMQNIQRQYGVLSTFTKGVALQVNTIQMRQNMIYTSYRFTFEPAAQSAEDNGYLAYFDGCYGAEVVVNDEYILIAHQPEHLLIRIYLPACHLTSQDYMEINNLLNSLRLDERAVE